MQKSSGSRNKSKTWASRRRREGRRVRERQWTLAWFVVGRIRSAPWYTRGVKRQKELSPQTSLAKMRSFLSSTAQSAGWVIQPPPGRRTSLSTRFFDPFTRAKRGVF